MTVTKACVFSALLANVCAFVWPMLSEGTGNKYFGIVFLVYFFIGIVVEVVLRKYERHYIEAFILLAGVLIFYWMILFGESLS